MDREELRFRQCLRKRPLTHADAERIQRLAQQTGLGGKLKGKRRKREKYLTIYKCRWKLEGWDVHWHCGHSKKVEKNKE